MNHQINMDTRPSPYERYSAVSNTSGKSKETNAAEKTPEEEKQINTDTVEITVTQEEPTEEDNLYTYMKKLQEHKKAKDAAQKKKLDSNAGNIRTELLSAKSSLMARLAISKAYQEQAQLMMCKNTDGYDQKEVEAALGKIKKVIRAGQMKVKNLANEEMEEKKLLRMQKQAYEKEIRKMKDELRKEKQVHRQKEKKACQWKEEIGNSNNSNSGNHNITENYEDYLNSMGVIPVSDITTADVPVSDVSIDSGISADTGIGGGMDIAAPTSINISV